MAMPQVIADRAVRIDRAARRRSAWMLHVGRAGLLIAVLACWQSASGPLLDPFFFSRPSDIAHAFARLLASGQFTENFVVTVKEVVLGYAAGAGLGIVAAVVLGPSRRALAIVEPFLVGIYAVPAVSLAPLIIIWFGLGIASKIVLAAYFAFFTVFLNGAMAIRNVPRGWIDTARLMGANRPQLFRKVILRAAAPQLLTGLRTAMPLAVIGALVGEFISSQKGIGFLIGDAMGRFDTAGAFAGILTLSVLVVAMTLLLKLGVAGPWTRR